MTCSKGIIRIFRQNGSSWYSLVVCEACVMYLVVQDPILKLADSLGFFLIFF
jgi:hypothetical protein